MIDAAYAYTTHSINELWHLVSKFTCNFYFIKETPFVISNLFFPIDHVGPFLTYTLRELVNLLRPRVDYHFNGFLPYS